MLQRSVRTNISGIEKIKLQDHTVYSGGMVDELFGSLAGHCTTRQILLLTEKVTRGFNDHQQNGAVFLHIEKAFDSI